MTQRGCVKVAFVDKVLPGKSGTFKDRRDAATYLDFQKAFDNLSQRFFKEVMLPLVKKGKKE